MAPNPIKLANLWRVIREVDLQGIRRQALASFDLLIIGDPALREELRAALSPGGASSPHPWIHTGDPQDALGPTTPTAAVLVTPSLPLSREAEAAVYALRRAHVPVAVAYVTGNAGGEAPHVPGHVVIRALDEEGVRQIASALLPLVDEGQRLALAHQLPAFRPAYYEMTIDDTARANATYSFTTGLAEVVPILTAPLNLGDIVILTKNQLIMSYRIVLASGRDGDPRAMLAEILGVLGGGLLFRQLARHLVGLIPIAGVVPKVAIAYGGTWAIGRAMVLWVTEGTAISQDTLQSLGAEGLARGRQIARELVSRARRGTRGGRWERFRRQLPGLSRQRRDEPPSPPSLRD